MVMILSLFTAAHQVFSQSGTQKDWVGHFLVAIIIFVDPVHFIDRVGWSNNTISQSNSWRGFHYT
jgi:hypothetical protein